MTTWKTRTQLQDPALAILASGWTTGKTLAEEILIFYYIYMSYLIFIVLPTIVVLDSSPY